MNQSGAPGDQPKNLPDWFRPAGPRAEFLTTERCFITEIINTCDTAGVSLALARVEPGTTTQLHSLSGIQEHYIIRQGCGIVEVDGLPQAVSAGDQITIAAGCPQRITNNDDTDLEFYCLCTPRFTPENYVNLEDAVDL